jgi:transposase
MVQDLHTLSQDANEEVPASKGVDVEVVAVARRRQFSTTYKRRIVREAAACDAPGEIGALLRREGLYSSHLATWRRELETAEHTALVTNARCALLGANTPW